MTLANLTAWFVLPVLALSVVLVLFRLLRGPSLPDRIVALDLMGTLAIGLAATFALAKGQAVFLDVAMLLSLLSFLGTVAFASYIEKVKR